MQELEDSHIVMSDYVQIKDQDSMVRDMHSMAVINVDPTEYNARQQRKKIAREQRERIEEQNKRIDMLQDDVAEIKRLVLALVESSRCQ